MRSLACGLALLAAGCGFQANQPSAGVTEFHFSSGTYVGIILIPLLLTAVGVVVLLKGETILKVFAAGGLLLLLLFAVAILPGIWQDTVIVDRQGVRQATGFWWSPTLKEYKFADTRDVRIVRKLSGPESRMSTVWEVTRKNGATFDIDPGDLWDHAEEQIIKLSGEHGVPVRDER
jgi:hypothetical protein